MPAVDLVLQQLVDDPSFRARVRADPRAALSDCALSPGDLETIEDALGDERPASPTINEVLTGELAGRPPPNPSADVDEEHRR